MNIAQNIIKDLKLKNVTPGEIKVITTNGIFNYFQCAKYMNYYLNSGKSEMRDLCEKMIISIVRNNMSLYKRLKPLFDDTYRRKFKMLVIDDTLQSYYFDNKKNVVVYPGGRRFYIIPFTNVIPDVTNHVVIDETKHVEIDVTILLAGHHLLSSVLYVYSYIDSNSHFTKRGKHNGPRDIMIGDSIDRCCKDCSKSLKFCSVCKTQQYCTGIQKHPCSMFKDIFDASEPMRNFCSVKVSKKFDFNVEKIKRIVIDRHMREICNTKIYLALENIICHLYSMTNIDSLIDYVMNSNEADIRKYVSQALKVSFISPAHIVYASFVHLKLGKYQIIMNEYMKTPEGTKCLSDCEEVWKIAKKKKTKLK